MKKKVIINAANIVFEKLFAMLVGFIVGAYVARYLGPENFGLLSFATSLAGLFMPLNRLGLNLIVVREVATNPEESAEIINSAFTLKAIASLLSLLITFSLSLFVLDDPIVSGLISILAIGQFFKAFNVLEFYFQTQLKSIKTTISRNISILVSAVYRYGLILSGSGLLFFGYAPLIDAFLAATLLCMFYFKEAKVVLKLNFDINRAKSLLKESLPIILAAMATAIDLKIDQVIIKFYLPVSDLGNYAAAARISELWYFVPSALMVSYLPDLSKRVKRGDDLTLMIKRLAAILFYTAFFVSIMTMFTSDLIIRTIFGAEYMLAAEILVIHIWGACFVYVGQITSKIIVARGLQKFLLYIRLVSSSLNILLNLIFIPKFGVIGAAYATLISYSVGHFIGYIFFQKTRDIVIAQLQGIFLPSRKLFIS